MFMYLYAKQILIGSIITVSALFGGAYIVKGYKALSYQYQLKRADSERKRVIKKIKREKDIKKRNELLDCVITMKECPETVSK